MESEIGTVNGALMEFVAIPSSQAVQVDAGSSSANHSAAPHDSAIKQVHVEQTGHRKRLKFKSCQSTSGGHFLDNCGYLSQGST